jgi:HlyD family secretion protein
MNKGCLIALIVFVVVLLGGAGATVYFLVLKEQQGPASFTLEAPQKTDIVAKTVATGSVQPRQEIQIKPQVSGIISSVAVEAGEILKEGDIIAKVKVIPDMANLSNAENRLARARINLDNATMDFARNSELREQGVIASADFQQFEIAKRQAQEELETAEDQLQIVKEGVTKRKGGTSNTLIRSTIAGMVLDVPVKQGNSVIEANNFNDGTTIASIANMDDLIFIGKVDESEVEKLHIGMALILTIGAIEGQTFDAELEYISPKGIEENGAIQFEIKAAVQLREDQFIRAGYSANADVVLDRRDSVLAISEALLQFDENQKPFVEVSTGSGQYEKKPVELGLSDGILVEVIGGVSATDSIKKWNQPIFE